MKKLSERGILFIRSFEGLKLAAYRDVKGILTIGWGHTGPDVKAGMKINEYQAETIFQKDLYEKSERFVRPLEQKIGYELTQNQYDALCSLVFNTGPDAIAPANSIFRALTLFAEKQLLHLIDDGSGMQKYCLCNCTHDNEHGCHYQHQGHVHLTCIKCHETICLEDVPIPSVPIPEGYVVHESEYVIKGICPKCQSPYLPK